MGPRTVLIGNAAQALHPVAGQGFNLGLRDAAMLAEVIAAERGDVGAAPLLQRFAAWRASDRSGVMRFTDALVKLFGDRRPGVSLLRNLGLLLFDLTPPAKSALARVSSGFGGPTPRLARGLPLQTMFDVLIVGGGPVGACAGALLRVTRARPSTSRSSSRIRPPPATAARRCARGRPVARQRAACCGTRAPGGSLPPGACAPTSACASGTRAWRRDSAAALVFDAADVGEPNLGYIVENRLLQGALLAAFAQAGGDIERPPSPGLRSARTAWSSPLRAASWRRAWSWAPTGRTRRCAAARG